MKKQVIMYDSPVDALIALSKRLNSYETQYQMASEVFLDKFNRGELGDSADFVEWAGDYDHFVAIKLEIEKSMRHVA